MALDTTVMNTAIATVAKDVGTTVTGIQTAITLYTLVMASLMITGGKVGQILGRKRAFSIGCIIYACGSLTTSLSPNLTVLIIGWSFLEGLGAVLIMPAIVALVASNFAQPERPRAYGLVAAAGAIAAALGPLIGGAFTTYASWRWVFAGEVLIVLAILAAGTADERHARRRRRRELDLVGTGAVSARPRPDRAGHPARRARGASCSPKPGSPAVARALPGDLDHPRGRRRARRRSWRGRAGDIARGEGALIDPAMLSNLQLRGGVTSFLFQFLLQAGMFFTVPLFLSIALGLSAIETGVRLLPLSLSLLLVRRRDPEAVPERLAAPGCPARVPAAVRRPGAADRAAGLRRRPRDRHVAAAARRRWASARWPRSSAASRSPRCPTSAAARSGASEHRNPARRVDRHRPCRRGAHLALTASFFAGVQEQPGRARDRPRRRRRSSRAGSRSSPTRT